MFQGLKSNCCVQVDLSSATNVLDRWIGAATRSLTSFVREEMGAYRLYTVVPFLVQFIESLTNIYVRYNRTRLKGRGGARDCKFALASLFDVLLTVCKVIPGHHARMHSDQCKPSIGQRPKPGRSVLTVSALGSIMWGTWEKT